MQIPVNSHSGLKVVHPRAARTVGALLSVVILGIFSIFGATYGMNSLVIRLDKEGENERSRMFIAESMSGSIVSMELDFFRLLGTRRVERRGYLVDSIDKRIRQVEQVLHVLKYGGRLERAIDLNLEGVDEMVRHVEYRLSPDDRSNMLAMIEVLPHLEQVRAKVAAASRLLDRHSMFEQAGDRAGEDAVDHEIKLLSKIATSLFVRLHENTNRLVYESSLRMDRLSAQREQQRKHYIRIKTIMVAIILSAVIVVGIVLGRQISVMTSGLQRVNRELEAANEAVEAALTLSREAEFEICLRLGRIAEYRDLETGRHTQRISEMAALLGRLTGLSDDMVEVLRRAAPLHDVGKVGVSDKILLKPGKLDEQEQQAIRLHTLLGDSILAEAGSYPAVEMGRVIALQHHEKWDGSGYPCGLHGEQIDLMARIVAIVDVFDALLSERPYKKAYRFDESLKIMLEGRATLFDPELLDLFIEHIDAFLLIRSSLPDDVAELEMLSRLMKQQSIEGHVLESCAAGP